MRRRRTSPLDDLPDGVPVRLVRFRSEEWAVNNDLAAAGAWYEARARWEAENGEPAPFLWDEESMPDEPFDPADV